MADDHIEALDVIGCAPGHIVPFHRPPSGVYTLSSLIQMRRASLTPHAVVSLGRDWSRRATPRSVARRAGQDVGVGDVILLHDADHYGSLGCWRATVGALPMLIERIRNAGLGLVALTAGD